MEGPPAVHPRISLTRRSLASRLCGSRISHAPSWRMAMRVPGSRPNEARIAAGITTCPLLLTVVNVCCESLRACAMAETLARVRRELKVSHTLQM